MDIFDLARESAPFSEHLEAWMCEATPELFCWLDGYLTSMHDTENISDDHRVALITMLSMTASMSRDSGVSSTQ